jgi:CBS domain-containing protein
MAQQTIADMLKNRTAPVVTCRSDDTIRLVVELLNRHKIGALAVTDGEGRLVGILSERDIVRALADGKTDVRARKASELMTRDVVSSRLSEAELEADVLRDYARATAGVSAH